MINLNPTKCNLCGGAVEYISNAAIYHGRQYGSGKCYHCTKCGAYVGTHRDRPYEALGILATPEMREWKIKCHDLFDGLWKSEQPSKRRRKRTRLYGMLAKELHIPHQECHFGHFDLAMLKQAYRILSEKVLYQAKNIKGVV